MLRSAIDRLKDAHSPALSFASRFDLAYNAAHALLTDLLAASDALMDRVKKAMADAGSMKK